MTSERKVTKHIGMSIHLTCMGVIESQQFNTMSTKKVGLFLQRNEEKKI